MIDVKQNFKTSFSQNPWCKICLLFRETQQHLVDCAPIRSRLKGIKNFEDMEYNLMYGKLADQEKYAKNYTLILSARDDLLSTVNQT